MIGVVYRRDTHNTGDLASSPAKYFNLGSQILEVDVLSDLSPLSNAHAVIVGGGGLLGNSFFDDGWQRLAELKLDVIILWGLGHNRHFGEPIGLSLDDLCMSIRLIGIRDYGLGFRWVPCASCMNKAFDRRRPALRDIVIYEHARIPLAGTGLENYPRLKNRGVSMEETLDFLGSANYIITNTYHGMYWATLLGRRVIAYPFSDKFHFYKYPVPLVKDEDWRAGLDASRRFPDALSECRVCNTSFYSDVRELIDT